MRYYLLVGTIAALAAAWSGGWIYIADQMRAEIQRLAKQKTQGQELTYRDMEITGFPFRVQVNMSKPRIVVRGGPLPFSWETDQIKAVGHSWQPRHILFDLTGQHQLAVNVGRQWRKLILQNGAAMASVETAADGKLEQLSLNINKPWLRYRGVSVLRGARLQFHARPAPGQSNGMDLALRADALEVIEGALPAGLISMPRTARLVDLQATATGLPEGAFTADQLGRWRDDGGTLEITAFRAQWGDMEIYVTGSLALDNEMRPIGALTARIKGHDELLDMLVVGGMMKKNAAAAARAVLGLLAAAGGGVLSVPVRLQDGQLFLGPAPVARLGPLLQNNAERD